MLGLGIGCGAFAIGAPSTDECSGISPQHSRGIGNRTGRRRRGCGSARRIRHPPGHASRRTSSYYPQALDLWGVEAPTDPATPGCSSPWPKRRPGQATLSPPVVRLGRPGTATTTPRMEEPPGPSSRSRSPNHAAIWFTARPEAHAYLLEFIDVLYNGNGIRSASSTSAQLSSLTKGVTTERLDLVIPASRNRGKFKSAVVRVQPAAHHVSVVPPGRRASSMFSATSATNGRHMTRSFAWLRTPRLCSSASGSCRDGP